MNKEDALGEYEEVSKLLEGALERSRAVELFGSEENKELKMIVDTLSELNEGFKSEIKLLADSSEWDRFCIAFFGETNAGKSTIIESLRIIYDEEKRREELLMQRKGYEAALATDTEHYKSLIETLNKFREFLITREAELKEAEREKALAEAKEQKKMKWKLVLCSACFGILGIVVGFLASILL